MSTILSFRAFASARD